MTTIEDTLTYIDGSKANGRLVVGWKPFTVGNVNAAGGELEWQIVEGAVSISLYANTGAQPTGSYYVVKYELENGAVYLEQWIVPDLPTVNLGQVRVAFPPSPSVMISPLQLTSLGAAPGMFLMWNGQRWVPGYPGTFSFVDPTLVKGDMIVRGDVAPATRLGVGLDGWTLIADSSQPLGIKWIAPVSGFADPTTTKGDLIVRGGSGTTRIGVGSDGSALMADSTLPLGVKWATGGSLQTPWLSDIDGATKTLFNAGKIGIGTVPASPTLLHVRGATSGLAPQSYTTAFFENGSTTYLELAASATPGPPNCGIVWSSGTSQTSYIIDYNGAVNWVAIGASRPIAIYTDATERMRITAAGNVGIGEANPSRNLQITTAAGVTTRINLTQLGTASFDIQTVPSVNALAFATGAGAELVRITPAGNVLSVWSTGINNNAGITLSTSNTGIGIGIYNTNPDPAARNWGIVSNFFAFGDFAICQSASQGANAFAAVGNSKLYFTAAGAIGIGTQAPTGSLHIMRTDGSYELKLTNSGVREYGIAVTTAGGLTFDDMTGGTSRMTLSTSGASVVGDVNCTGVFRVQGLPAARIIAYLDQTGARALNTVYLNSQTCPIFVAVTATINQSQFMQLLTDLGNPPTNVVCTQSNASGSLTINQTLNGWVMSGQYYKVNAPSATLIKWFEWQ